MSLSRTMPLYPHHLLNPVPHGVFTLDDEGQVQPDVHPSVLFQLDDLRTRRLPGVFIGREINHSVTGDYARDVLSSDAVFSSVGGSKLSAR